VHIVAIHVLDGISIVSTSIDVAALGLAAFATWCQCPSTRS
jgi:hypothetical protein